jgi:arsenate reductase
MITVYGIGNCDKCRAALKWFRQHDVTTVFHDLRSDGFPTKAFEAWQRSLGIDALVNKRSTTWRGLDETLRASLNEANAATLVADNPTLLKRPVVVAGSAVAIGYDEAQWTDMLGLGK